MKITVVFIMVITLLFVLSSCALSDKPRQTTISIDESTTTKLTTQSTTSSSTKQIGVVINVDKSVNLRSKPTTDSEIIGKVSNGTQLNILKVFYNADWHEVEYHGQSAFIYKKYFDTNTKSTTESSSEPTENAELGLEKGNPIIISASQLVKEVDKDWENASRNYKGKYLQVTGKIIYISSYSDLEGYYFINTLDSGKTRVVVWFDLPFPNCKKGETITVVGLCQSAEESTEIIYCSLVD